MNDFPGKDAVSHNETHKRVSPSTYDEFGIPSHGNDGSVHCPEKLLHDDLDMPLSWSLQEDTPV